MSAGGKRQQQSARWYQQATQQLDQSSVYRVYYRGKHHYTESIMESIT